MSDVTLKVDTSEFLRTASTLSVVIKKDLKDIINREAFFVTAEAIKETHKADIAKITTELGGVAQTVKQITRGKNKGRFRASGWIISTQSLAEKILRARLFARHEAQPTKEEIAADVLHFITVRCKSVAFLKSGWIAAIKIFAPLVGRSASSTKGAQQIGPVAKGGGTPAVESDRPFASIYNSAATGRAGSDEALARYVLPPLQAAVDTSSQRMANVIENQMKKRLSEQGVKFL